MNCLWPGVGIASTALQSGKGRAPAELCDLEGSGGPWKSGIYALLYLPSSTSLFLLLRIKPGVGKSRWLHNDWLLLCQVPLWVWLPREDHWALQLLLVLKDSDLLMSCKGFSSPSCDFLYKVLPFSWAVRAVLLVPKAILLHQSIPGWPPLEALACSRTPAGFGLLVPSPLRLNGWTVSSQMKGMSCMYQRELSSVALFVDKNKASSISESFARSSLGLQRAEQNGERCAASVLSSVWPVLTRTNLQKSHVMDHLLNKKLCPWLTWA